MDFQVADPIREALVNYAQNVPLGYYSTPDSYYDAFIEWEKKYHGYEVQREWICEAPGIVAAFNWVTLMSTKPDDGVIILTPCYYPMLQAVTNNDRKLVMCDMVKEGRRYSVDYEKFENDIVENNVKLFIMSSPHNPVGKVWREEELKMLMEICRRHGVLVISDEIHGDFEWADNKHRPTATVGDYDEFLITMCSASKSFNIAGCQNSLVIIPDERLRVRYKEFTKRIAMEGLNSFGYVATEAAFSLGRPWFEEVKEQIYANYSYLMARFSLELPNVTVSDLQGTYLLWLDFSKYFQTQEQVEDFFINRCKIALDYGSWFGGDRFAPFVRMNLATSHENINKAITAIVKEINAL